MTILLVVFGLAALLYLTINAKALLAARAQWLAWKLYLQGALSVGLAYWLLFVIRADFVGKKPDGLLCALDATFAIAFIFFAVLGMREAKRHTL
ncbi:MAG: hypothetical protein WCF77_03310 [Minisyncoccia bacterium]